VDKVVFVGAARESSHGEVSAVRHLDFNLLPFPFLDQVSRGYVGNRGSHTQLPFLAFGGSQAFQRGLGTGTHGVEPQRGL
jgi:hypothetical protein